MLFIKGLLIGLGKVIPGVSGSVIAISLNEYENMIYSISNINKKNILYLFKIGLGILLSIIVGSKLLIYAIDRFESYIYILFALLIILGIPKIIKEVNNFYYTIITTIFILLFSYINNLNIGCNYFILGIIESVSMIVPGISGTAIYNSLGVYDEILKLFSTLYLIELSKILPFILGMIVGGISSIKVIDYCFKKYKSITYSIILGLLISSIILMIIKG